MAEDQAKQLRALVQGSTVTASGNATLMRIIAVTSGKGGVGKTNISINLAIALTALGQRVVVFDGDLGLANLDVICGITPKYTLEDVVYGVVSLKDVLMDGPEGIKIIPGGAGSGLLVNLEQSTLQTLLEKMLILEELADILIIDTGAGISRGVIQLLEAADEIILVVTPEPTSLTDAYGLAKTLHLRGKHRNLGVLVNRVRSREDADTTFSRLSVALDRFLKYNANYLGYIYEDHFLTKAVMKQTPVLSGFPTSPASQCIKGVAQKLLGSVYKYPSRVPLRGIRGFIEGLRSSLVNR